MKARDFRHAAWESLRGKWGTMVLATLIYVLILGACGTLAFIFVGGIAALLLTGAFVLGLAGMGLAAARGQSVNAGQVFDGFKQYGSSLALYLLIAIFTFLWTLLLIVPGIVKALSYSMSWYILNDDPSIGANAARKRSMELMKGHKWRLFCLQLSFIGWGILCMLTLSILTLWVTPYMETAMAHFYRNLTDGDAPAEQAPAAQQ